MLSPLQIKITSLFVNVKAKIYQAHHLVVDVIKAWIYNNPKQLIPK